MKNYIVKNTSDLDVINLEEGIDKTFLGSDFELSSMEVSFNTLKPNAKLSYIHSHVENEEVFFVISGNGAMFIDGDEFEISKNDVVKVNPKGKRTLRSGELGLVYICIQAKEGSLSQKLKDDSKRHPEEIPSWFK